MQFINFINAFMNTLSKLKKISAAALMLIGFPFFAVADIAPVEMNVSSFNMMLLATRVNPNPKFTEYSKVTMRAWEKRKDMLMPLFKYHDFDICGAQELKTKQLEYLFPNDVYAYVDNTPSIKSIYMSNVIIYKKGRFEVLDSGVFLLTQSKGDRHCQWAKFKEKKSGREFFVFNIHAEAHNGKLLRLESAKTVVSKISEIAKGSVFFLTGDFNAQKGSPEMDVYFNSGILRDAKEISKTPVYGPKTNGAFQYEKGAVDLKGTPIDFIFVSRGVNVEKFAVLSDNDSGIYPSDHLPLAARVKF